MKLLVIVPAFNEQDSILNTIEDIKTNAPFADYLVINDCSTDNTQKLLIENEINHISLPVNLGLSGAIQTGFKYAFVNGYDCAIQFDGDGQHSAKYINKMLEQLNMGYDIVIGSRFVDFKKPWSLRMIGSRVIGSLIRLTTRKSIKDPTSGMRLFNRKMIYDFGYNMNRRPEPDTIVYQLRHGAKISEVQVEMNERYAGESIYSGLFSSFKYMLSMVTSILFLSY